MLSFTPYKITRCISTQPPDLFMSSMSLPACFPMSAPYTGTAFPSWAFTLGWQERRWRGEVEIGWQGERVRYDGRVRG